MLRVLFIVLSVVSIALAVVLKQPLLYLLAAGLLVAAAIMLTATVRRRQAAERRTVSPAVSTAPRDDLSALGIMEIRPKAEATSGSADKVEEDVDGTEPVRAEMVEKMKAPTSRSTPRSSPSGDSGAGPLFAGPSSARSKSDTAAGAVRKRSRSPRIMVEGVVDSFSADVMLPTLRALRAAVDANTVALLRQEEAALRYYVDAIVSRNAFARNGGRFVAAEPLLAGASPLTPVVYECTGPESFDAHRLGYYHDSIAVHQVAFVPLTASDVGGDHYLLVADSMEDGKLDGVEANHLLTRFSHLIQALVGGAMTVPSSDTPSGEPMRSRREIIEEEMEKARGRSEPLALALVHLNAADAIGKDGEKAVGQAEVALEKVLQLSAPEDRVERFGELTYGIFRSVDGDQAATWASGLQVELAEAEEPLSGGVSIGVAVLGDQHDGPDKLRADATTALRESFESGECIVLE